MGVNSNFIEVIFYRVDHFFDLRFARVLKKHLTKEISQWMHHKFVKRSVFE
jgi:hypothetical protein